jgi:hypothetical protein
VLHELKKEIGTKDDEADGNIKIVRFNPWWFSGQEDLIRAFFDELISVIGKGLGEETKGALKMFAAGVSKTSGLVKYGVGLLPMAGVIPEGLRNSLIDAIGGAVDASQISLQDLRNQVAKQLAEGPFRTLVIIDDIDRLSGDEQLQIFRLVKSLADLPKIDYLLAFDDDLARNVLQDRPEYRSDSDYLEKIVQAPFHLPVVPDAVLSHWFVDELNKQVSEEDEGVDQRRWVNIRSAIVDPQLKTPRAVKRLLNALKVRWPFVKDEVDLADFVALETLRLFEPTIYDAIKQERSWLLGRAGGFEDEDQEGLERVKQRAGPEKEDLILDALKHLFPRIANTSEGSMHFSEGEPVPGDSLRLAQPDRFEVYFRLGVSDATLSRPFLEDLLANGQLSDFAKLFAEQANTKLRRSGTKVPVLLNEIGPLSQKLNDDRKAALVEALLSHGDLLLAPEDFGRGGLFDNPVERCVSLLRILLSQLREASRSTILMRSFQKEDGTIVGSAILRTLQGERGCHGLTWKSELGDPLVSDEVITELEKLQTSRGLRKLSQEEVFDYPRRHRFLVEHLSYIGTERVKEVVQLRIDTPEQRARTAQFLIVGGRYSSEKSSYETVANLPSDLVDLERLEHLIGEDLNGPLHD